MINYFTSNKEVRDAWFKFKRECPDRAISVSSFVAGYNAATQKLYTVNVEIRQQQNRS